LGGESRSSEMLPKLIVEIVTQPSPLTIRHLRDFLIESPPLEHLALVRRCSFVDATIKFSNKHA
jgi:hypothetical protein